ncbi:MAG TPA: PEP-CTERM sorting domain-containing protein [Phycisphaerae bacterium]|nr:PEP-CTERM sorting domain-containing protein [Phycisphaerae bacterium]
MKTSLILAVIALCSVATGTEITMDAAELSLKGEPLDLPMVLAVADNRDGTKDMTGVVFKPVVDSAFTLDFIPDADNPWLVSHPYQWRYEQDDVGWRVGESISATSWWPLFYGLLLTTHSDYEPMPADWHMIPTFGPELAPLMWDSYYNFIEYPAGVVPAGHTWTRAYQIAGGGKLFHSPAEGDLDLDGVTYRLIDEDPMPQMAMEPGTVALLALGAAAVAARRKAKR